MTGKLILAILLLSAFMPYTAYAQESVIFDNRIKGATALYLSRFTQDHLKSQLAEYDVATIDLNGDYYYEYVLKKKECTLDIVSRQFCTFILVGEEETKLIELGTFYSKKIKLSDKKHHGIYDILAFQSKKNDYEYERYIWSPDEKTYIRETDLSSADNRIK